MSAVESLPAVANRNRFFDALAPGGRRALFVLGVIGVCLLFAFPVFWLVLTSLRPGYAVYYVHRGTDFTLDNFHEVLSTGDRVPGLVEQLCDLDTGDGSLAGRDRDVGLHAVAFRGPIPNLWFSAIYVFRCVPYVSWVLPLYFVTRALGIFDTYWGLLLPHVAVHICFFSWIMKGFFDGIDPSMEYAAMIDGCSRWGAFLRVALPAAIPGLTALAILCWLYTWNEFLFALILTAQKTPILTVVMAQFVHELGMEWHLMSATAVLSLGPALIVTIFGQKYVIRGLKV